MRYIFIAFLLVSAIYDIWKKRIPSILIWGFIVIMAGYRMMIFVKGMTSVTEMMGLLLPGMLLVVLSHISNEVGEGDGLLVIATGCYLGGMRNMGMVFLAFLLAAFVAIGFLIGARSMKNKRIAFAPYILMASMIIETVL